jgi:coenzyme F420-reducing hydrogenase delta subunit/Pyruvate/2-oxoacid:ferredoxin oxidoreductase delta subunit
MTNDETQITDQNISLSTKVLVIGEGLVAGVTAHELVTLGYHVLWVSPESDLMGGLPPSETEGEMFSDMALLITRLKETSRVEVQAPAEVTDFEGSPGNFHVTLRDGGGARSESVVGAVILANEPVKKTCFGAWGLHESEKVKTLTWIESKLKSGDTSFLSSDDPQRIVFVCGFSHLSYPFTQKRAVEAAMGIASERRHQVLFITEHFKVAQRGMESLMRGARDEGVLFVKLTGMRPGLEMQKEHIRVTYYDEALESDLTVDADFVVLEESCEAASANAGIAATLGIDRDRRDYFQAENIYNQPIYTNRVGVFAVGSSKGPSFLEEGLEEARAACVGVHELLNGGRRRIPENRILLDTKRCTICLTCYRLCPHGAISYLNRRPVFSELACRVCGICAAECPMDAIQITGFEDGQIRSEIKGPFKNEAEDSMLILALCCQNSAFEAARLANFRGRDLPNGFRIIRVPCAGRVDPDYLLTAFRAGADGVMVLGCHPESCRSMSGNELARWRICEMKEAIAEAGLEEARLTFGNLAPGMSSEFVKMAYHMRETIQKLGVNPIRKRVHARHSS